MPASKRARTEDGATSASELASSIAEASSISNPKRARRAAKGRRSLSRSSDLLAPVSTKKKKKAKATGKAKVHAAKKAAKKPVRTPMRSRASTASTASTATNSNAPVASVVACAATQLQPLHAHAEPPSAEVAELASARNARDASERAHNGGVDRAGPVACLWKQAKESCIGYSRLLGVLLAQSHSDVTFTGLIPADVAVALLASRGIDVLDEKTRDTLRTVRNGDSAVQCVWANDDAEWHRITHMDVQVGDFDAFPPLRYCWQSVHRVADGDRAAAAAAAR